MNISKAIIPAAGLGTRFLPLTKTIPKEMLPLLAKPAIQTIIEEGLASAIANFCIITNKDKQAIKDYFSPTNPQLKTLLTQKNKLSLLDHLDTIIDSAHFTFIDQSEPRGLGDAIFMAKETIGNEYFGVFLPDDIIFGKTPGLAQLIAVAQQEQASIIAVQEMPKELISAYGVIATTNERASDIFEISDVIEKPQPENAPSNLAIIGRYVLSPTVFNAIQTITTKATEEIGLTDALAHMIHNGEKILAYKIKGQRFDLGSPPGWLAANTYLAEQ